MTPAQRALRSRLGGLATASRHNPTAYTAAARAAWKSSDHTECRLCGTQSPIPAALAPAERERRRHARLTAHYARMAYTSVRSRRKKAGPADNGPALEAADGPGNPRAA